jgi:hypothetical protein
LLARKKVEPTILENIPVPLQNSNAIANPPVQSDVTGALPPSFSRRGNDHPASVMEAGLGDPCRVGLGSLTATASGSVNFYDWSIWFSVNR